MKYAAKARMSKKELTLVKYVVRQLTAAYTDSRGKPRYARNMDQVMKDIFGVKRFTKCLQRGIRNEPEMIALMKALDIQTIWTICRSSEHYRMLCSLVAMDNAIVKMNKKCDEYLTMAPQDRPGRKYAKAQKELKRLQKSYNRTVKTFREIFDIKSRSAGSTIRGIMEYAENWRDRNTMSDDIFGYFDDSPLTESVESMENFLRRNAPQPRSAGKRPEHGALGIFDDNSGYSDYEEDYFGDEDGDDEPGFSSDQMDELVDRLATIISQRYGMPVTQPAPVDSMYPRTTYTRSVPTASRPESGDRISRLEAAFERNNALLGQFIDALNSGATFGGDSEPYEEDLGEMMLRRAPGSEVSMDEALRMANGDLDVPPPAEGSSDKIQSEELPSDPAT